MKLKKRIAALLMAGAMVCSTLPVNVLAVESSDQNVGGLCEHHTEPVSYTHLGQERDSASSLICRS